MVGRHTIRQAAVAAILVAAGTAPALAGPLYTITDLGSLGGTATFGNAINDSGQVTGVSYTTGNHTARAFLYSGATLRDLGSLDMRSDSDGVGFGINASGLVTGFTTQSGVLPNAFIHDGTAMRGLGTLGTTITFAMGFTSQGQGINAGGWVTGFSNPTQNGPQHAFLYDGTAMHDLGTLGGTTSFGYGINAAGAVTGNAALAGDGATHAFLYDGATMQDLGTLGGTDSFGRAINASGQVAGSSRITGSNDTHAFLYDGATMQDLGTLGGRVSRGLGLNDLGAVVGWAYTAASASHAFLYDGGTMYDLNDLISPADPLYGAISFTSAAGINASGQIVADATTDQGERTFLLTPLAPAPVPEAPGWALLATALFALGAVSRRRCAARRG